MRALLFEKQKAFGAELWTEFAVQAGIEDIEQFDECVNDTTPLERIERSKKLADKFGIQGTPTIIVNGWKMPAPPSPWNFDEIVQTVVEDGLTIADVDFFATGARN